MSKPHKFADRIIREALHDPLNLRELLELVIGESALRFEYDQTQYDERELILPDLARRRADLLCRIPYRTETGLVDTHVCILAEHQSDPEHGMPLRMLGYATQFWQRLWDDSQQNRATKIPALLPIVFHTGPGPWRTNRELGDLIESPSCPFVAAPIWPIHYLNLAELSAHELLRSARGWHKAMAVMRAEGDEDVAAFRGVLERAVAAIDPMATVDVRRHWRLLDYIMKWVFSRRAEDEHDELFRAVVHTVRPEHREQIRNMSSKIRMTWEEAAEARAQERYELGRQEGEVEGIAKGVAEGKAEGEAHGEVLACRMNLRGLLMKRFGSVPEDLMDRIESSSDVVRLRRAIEQTLDITSVRELDI